METYFEWQTPDGFRPKKSAESLKKTFRPALLEAIFSIFVLGIIVVLWFLLGIKPGSLFAGLYFILVMLVVLALVFPPVLGFVLVLFALRRPPKSGRKIKLTENKIIFGEGRRSFCWYKDIQSFRIAHEQFKDTTMPVLELESFDGKSCGFGLGSKVSLEQLNTALSERIIAARKEAKKLCVGRGTWRKSNLGLTLMVYGVIALLLFSANFLRVKSAQNQEFKVSFTERVGELESGQTSEQQIDTLKKVVELSLSTELLAESNVALIGMTISVSIFLIGCVLMLWGNNIILKNKIARLQAYWADKLESEAK